MVRTLLRRTFNAMQSAASTFMQTYPPGHFYSPVPAMHEAKQHQATVHANRLNRRCPGIDLRDTEQLKLLQAFVDMQPACEFPEYQSNSRRYFYANSFFPLGDATILSAFMRHFRPARIIEIGSGFSSAAMLDVDEQFLGSSVEYTFIDPYPQRLEGLLRNTDRQRCSIVASKLQAVPASTYSVLAENDILFVDSSHVLKAGSDVMHILFELLPSLSPGVMVHVHDVPWPFEYPAAFFDAGRAWNEAYAVRAFLQFNDAFEIRFFNSYMRLFAPGELLNAMPAFSSYPSSGLWLQKVR